MLKIKLLLEKQENIIREKLAEEKRMKAELENHSENKKNNNLMLNNEFKTTQNNEVPTDDKINDLSKYNFHKLSTNLQMMGCSSIQSQNQNGIVSGNEFNMNLNLNLNLNKANKTNSQISNNRNCFVNSGSNDLRSVNIKSLVDENAADAANYAYNANDNSERNKAFDRSNGNFLFQKTNHAPK